MAIALVGTPTTAVGSSVTATTVAITVPTGSVGDLLVFGVSAASNANTNATPPSITAAAALTKLGEMYGDWQSGTVYYRFVQSGDATSYTFTLSGAAPVGAVCARYSGVSALRFWSQVGDTGAVSDTTTSVVFPEAGLVRSTDLVLNFACMGTNAKNTTQTTALSTPAGWTNVVNRLGATSSVTSSYHTSMALYSRASATDRPTVTGSTGQYFDLNIVLIDSSNPGPDAPGGTISFVNSSTAAVTAG